MQFLRKIMNFPKVLIIRLNTANCTWLTYFTYLIVDKNFVICIVYIDITRNYQCQNVAIYFIEYVFLDLTKINSHNIASYPGYILDCRL